MSDLDKIMVMSQETWDAMKDDIAENAMKSHDPIGYLGIIDGIQIEIDDTLPLNYVEVYERYMWEAVKRYGKAE